MFQSTFYEVEGESKGTISYEGGFYAVTQQFKDDSGIPDAVLILTPEDIHELYHTFTAIEAHLEDELDG